MSVTDSVCDDCGAGVRPYTTVCERCVEHERAAMTARLVLRPHVPATPLPVGVTAEDVHGLCMGIVAYLEELRRDGRAAS